MFSLGLQTFGVNLVVDQAQAFCYVLDKDHAISQVNLENPVLSQEPQQDSLSEKGTQRCIQSFYTL